jgi:hypothetical protein
MARADGTGSPEPAAPPPYGTIVVVGGGCYGEYYVRQLRRARERGALMFERLIVVDHDEDCAVGRRDAAGLELAVGDWSEFFRTYLGGEAAVTDAIVPSPLMPHLLFQWLEQRARERWPSRTVSVETPDVIGNVPWQKGGAESTRYVSFAEWMCPVNCVEPRTCPHTREARSWSLPRSLAAHVAAARARGERVDGPVIFHCTHRAYGVGMIDVRDVLDGERLLVAAAGRGEARLLVGTVSHCHGALGLLVVGGAGPGRNAGV